MSPQHNLQGKAATVKLRFSQGLGMLAITTSTTDASISKHIIKAQ